MWSLFEISWLLSGKYFEWKTRSHARSNWSVGVGKALFHISEFWLTGDVVPTVICISTLDWYARGRNSRPPSSPLRVWSINNVASWYFVDVYLLIKVVCGSFLVGNLFS